MAKIEIIGVKNDMITAYADVHTINRIANVCMNMGVAYEVPPAEHGKYLLTTQSDFNKVLTVPNERILIHIDSGVDKLTDAYERVGIDYDVVRMKDGADLVTTQLDFDKVLAGNDKHIFVPVESGISQIIEAYKRMEVSCGVVHTKNNTYLATTSPDFDKVLAANPALKQQIERDMGSKTVEIS